MPYILFLTLFLGLPIIVLGWRMRRQLRRHQLAWIAALMAVALVYTTPWDNYLVANRVWWYDPKLVLGVTIGWVPIEEYAFFLMQPIMVGLWMLLIRRYIAPGPNEVDNTGVRVAATALLCVVWAASVLVLVRGWMPGNYLALILVWAIPPIALQTAFGADILWKEWRRVTIGLTPAVLYLSLADALAIRSGTWTINSERSLNLMLGAVLPFEEFVFFVVTNVLIVFSMVLLLSPQSQRRLHGVTGKRVNLISLPDRG